MKQTMATIYSLSRPNLHLHAQKNTSSSTPFKKTFQCHVKKLNAKPATALLFSTNQRQSISTVICSATEEDHETATVAAVEEVSPVNEVETASVSVPVSPSDLLTMFFQAEGTMSEAAIPAVTSALQETEGISNLRVQVVEGIASVELMKQTTIQATGVASNLVEAIQGSGFKLQTLNLSFEDEEEALVA